MTALPPAIIDTHCHLTNPDLAPRAAEVITNAQAAGVARIITVACDLADLDAAKLLHARHPVVSIAAGIHPHEAGRASEMDLERLATAWGSPGVVAAGEMGLDYHYDFSDPATQRKVLGRQLRLAAETRLPIVIHCREAHDDVVSMLQDAGFAGRPVVFHCFSGTAEQADELRSLGWRASFTGIVTFRNATEVQQACRDTPDDQIMFETDAPYLTPEPVRRHRPNEPKNVIHTVRFAAELRGQDLESLAAASTANAQQFYGLTEVNDE